MIDFIFSSSKEWLGTRSLWVECQFPLSVYSMASWSYRLLSAKKSQTSPQTFSDTLLPRLFWTFQSLPLHSYRNITILTLFRSKVTENKYSFYQTLSNGQQTCSSPLSCWSLRARNGVWVACDWGIASRSSLDKPFTLCPKAKPNNENYGPSYIAYGGLTYYERRPPLTLPRNQTKRKKRKWSIFLLRII